MLRAVGQDLNLLFRFRTQGVHRGPVIVCHIRRKGTLWNSFKGFAITALQVFAVVFSMRTST